MEFKNTIDDCIEKCCKEELNFKMDKSCILSIYPEAKCKYMSAKFSERCPEGVRYYCLKNENDRKDML